MVENTDTAFAFDPFDQFTIIVTMPDGVQVTYAKYGELAELDLIEPGPGISVEVIPPARTDGTPRDGVMLEPGQSLKALVDGLIDEKGAAEPEPEVVVLPEPDVVVRDNAGPRAAMGPVGPDPKQEVAKSVPVKSVTGATGPKGKRS